MADEKALRRRVEVIATNKDGTRLFGGTYPDGTFGVFGGGIENGETIEEAAAREFLEETGRRIRNLRRLDVSPVENPWPKGEPPYSSDEDKAKDRARYRGDKTYYVVGEVSPQRPRKTTDYSHLKNISFQKPETALRKLEEVQGDKVYQKLKKGRLEALKKVLEEKEQEKQAFVLGFMQRWQELMQCL